MRLLRIAHIDTERTWRGGEQQLCSLAKYQEARGHENIVVGRSDSDLSKRLLETNIPYVPIDPWGEWDPISPHRLGRALLSHGIDVIHAHTSHGISLGLLARRGLNIPLVATRRVDFHLRSNWFCQWKYRSVDHLIAVSTAVRRVLCQDGIPGEKISVVADGIDFSRVEGITPVRRDELGFPNDSFVVGQVAALAPHKDQNTLIEAIAILRPRFPTLRCVLVGSGENLVRLRASVKRLGLTGTVHFTGFRADALRFLAGFDVFCLSSKEEGLGSSLLDAMALRIPIVATTAGGIPDLIENEQEGFLVPPLNPRALAQALERMFDGRGAHESMIQRAREKSLRFDISRTAEGTGEVYEALVERSGRLA